MNIKQKYLIALVIYLIVIFSVEFLYRNKLYELSVEYISKIEQEGFFYYFYMFWSYIYLIGVIIIGLIITLFFYPINIFFCHISLLIFFIFFISIFKSLYSNQRPYWDIYLNWKHDNITLPKPTECDGEFGNPSGHCIIDVYSLFLWHLFISSNIFNKMEENIKKKILKYSSLIITLVCMFFVAYSRIHRQMHSFNQIIHGTAIGLALFFVYCYIFEYNKMSLNDFILFLSRFKYIIIPILLVLYALSVTFGLTIHNSKEDEYLNILREICGYADENHLFGKNTSMLSSIIFIVIGGYLGFLYINHKINNNEILKKIINNWNKGKIIKIILIVFFSFLLTSIFLLPFLIISSSYYVVKFIIFLICSFLYGFLSFGPVFCFVCEKLKRVEFEEQQSLISSENNNEI